MGRGAEKRAGSWGWRAAYALTAAATTIATWTVVRPHLVLTDGMPEATDPMTPFGVAVANVLFVVVVWSLVGAIHILADVTRGRRRRAPLRDP